MTEGTTLLYDPDPTLQRLVLSGGGVTETEAVAKADAALAASRGAFEAWAVGRLAGIEAKLANESDAARNLIALAQVRDEAMLYRHEAAARVIDHLAASLGDPAADMPRRKKLFRAHALATAHALAQGPRASRTDIDQLLATLAA
ncbi:MAG: hypothetical protein JWM77_1447 [Rhodospirillales bacterium]|jgi:hypothetical protein|nr:hypothetical protein [Rhodospirillales bacterium]